MKKKLTEAEFLVAVKGMDVGEQTLMIARGVLVEGRPQSEFVTQLGVSKGAVSQSVNRVWKAAQDVLPEGFERVTAVLPQHQAFIVKKWARDADSQRKRSKS